jgi:hypothetical protein
MIQDGILIIPVNIEDKFPDKNKKKKICRIHLCKFKKIPESLNRFYYFKIPISCRKKWNGSNLLIKFESIKTRIRIVKFLKPNYCMIRKTCNNENPHDSRSRKPKRSKKNVVNFNDVQKHRIYLTTIVFMSLT